MQARQLSCSRLNITEYVVTRDQIQQNLQCLCCHMCTKSKRGRRKSCMCCASCSGFLSGDEYKLPCQSCQSLSGVRFLGIALA